MFPETLTIKRLKPPRRKFKGWSNAWFRCSRGCFSQRGQQGVGKRQGRACREQGGVPVDIATSSLSLSFCLSSSLWAPTGTDTKIISSSTAYENSLVKQHGLVPRCRPFQRNRGEAWRHFLLVECLSCSTCHSPPLAFFNPIPGDLKKECINASPLWRTSCRSYFTAITRNVRDNGDFDETSDFWRR